jgi:hypothetical protein
LSRVFGGHVERVNGASVCDRNLDVETTVTRWA